MPLSSHLQDFQDLPTHWPVHSVSGTLSASIHSFQSHALEQNLYHRNNPHQGLGWIRLQIVRLLREVF